MPKNHFKDVKESCRFSICKGGRGGVNIWKMCYFFTVFKMTPPDSPPRFPFAEGIIFGESIFINSQVNILICLGHSIHTLIRFWALKSVFTRPQTIMTGFYDNIKIILISRIFTCWIPFYQIQVCEILYEII